MVGESAGESAGAGSDWEKAVSELFNTPRVSIVIAAIVRGDRILLGAARNPMTLAICLVICLSVVKSDFIHRVNLNLTPVAFTSVTFASVIVKALLTLILVDNG